MFSSKEKLSSNCPRSYPSFVYELSNISDKDTTFFDSEWTDVMSYGSKHTAWTNFREFPHHFGNNNILELGVGMCTITEWTTN
ncbi:hypothetical protein LIPSTDRAFT_71159 [Lipomyces starkeyi NRRL Y-11557]|uniref:Uncharacterized protein n=1 Tax=Lipomyces starkeyi NRRL Y-11557 TaxID=675824 RepID=A0A1E3Q5B9_LIPST|nr:hypothetical protein LIPSTDRAFT_71159 [Lipomyces starkeyi NRRL Y-11557]